MQGQRAGRQARWRTRSASLCPRGRLHPAFNALDQELASRGKDVQSRDGEGFRLNIVNAVWGQQGHPFRDSFLDVLAESYGAGVRSADFSDRAGGFQDCDQ